MTVTSKEFDVKCRSQHTFAFYIFCLLWGFTTTSNANGLPTQVDDEKTKALEDASRKRIEVKDEEQISENVIEKSDESENDSIIYETRISKLPANQRIAGAAHRIDEEDLNKHKHDDIHQVLAQTPGVYVREEEGFGLRPNIGMRGGNSNRSDKLTLMEDGVLIAPAPYSAPAAYYFPLTMRMTGIDVYKGPAATRFGPNTIGGAIDLKTRAIPYSGIHGILDLAYGSFETTKVLGSLGYGSKHIGFLSEVALLNSGGFKSSNLGGTHGFSRVDAMLKARVNTDLEKSAWHRLDFEVGYGQEDSEETYLGLTLDDFVQNPNRRYDTTASAKLDWHHTQARVRYRFQKDEKIDFRTTLYRNDLWRDWSKINGVQGGADLHSTLLNPPVTGRGARTLAILRGAVISEDENEAIRYGTNSRRYVSQGIHSEYNHRFAQKRTSQTLRMGARFHHDSVVRDEFELNTFLGLNGLESFGDGRNQLRNEKGETLSLALNTMGELAFGDFLVVPSLRFEWMYGSLTNLDVENDRDTAARSFLSPGLGVAYAFPYGILGFVGVHRGFSPVAPGQASDVQPEESWNSELGIRLNQEHLNLNAAGFTNFYQNILGNCSFAAGCDPSDVTLQFNGGRALAAGAELAGQARFPLSALSEARVNANYTFTHTQFLSEFRSSFPQYGDVNAGAPLPYIPTHRFQISPELQISRWSMNVAMNYRGRMFDSAEAAEPLIRPLFIVNASTSYALFEDLDIYFKIENMFNARAIVSWRPFGARPNKPLTAMLGLRGTL